MGKKPKEKVVEKEIEKEIEKKEVVNNKGKRKVFLGAGVICLVSFLLLMTWFENNNGFNSTGKLSEISSIESEENLFLFLYSLYHKCFAI